MGETQRAGTWAGERANSKGGAQPTSEIFRPVDVRIEIWELQEMGAIRAGSQATVQEHGGQALLLQGDTEMAKAS